MKDQKNVENKIQPLLLPYEAFVAYAKVSDYGQSIYGDRLSWQNSSTGIWTYSNALARHLLEIMRGKIIDQDSKLPHVYHILWNAVAMVWHYQHGTQEAINRETCENTIP